ncbi:MAG: prephenate dehydrogenase/arogenate dehydrogenase family protein, partial [Myxococcales bacterium]|nr:prephenate dehydrogenase/arogenate dehydrogenase family protein [Myxococcales bacterium]
MSAEPFPGEAVLVVGVGLIGGSIALGLRNAGAREIWGADLPRGLAAIDEPQLFSRLIEADQSSLKDASARAGLVVLATPLPVIEQQLAWLSEAVCVTDCGSAKRDVCERAEQLGLTRFCGGHPMAGKERGGFEHASAQLFRGRSWFICPTETTDVSSVERVRELALVLGAQPVVVAPDAHDHGVALTSHANQLVASAMVKLAGRDRRRFAGPGFADATRVGGGPEGMWSGILTRNSVEVAAALEELESELRTVRESLARGDVSAALELLAEARRL